MKKRTIKVDAEDDGDYADFDNDDDNDEEPEEGNLSSRRSDFARSFFPESEPPAKKKQQQEPRFVPFDPNCDVTQQRPGYQIVDNVSYYNLWALGVLLYANVSEGVSIPAVFDAEKQSM